MSSLNEIRAAVAELPASDRMILMAELFASEPLEPDLAQLEGALQSGHDDVLAGRVKPIEDVRALLSRWTARS